MCDNQGTIAVTQNPTNHQRTKHIDIRYHFIRDLVQSGEIIVDYIPSQSNLADVLTKPLDRAQFSNLIAQIKGAC